jgi:hypothetical protein
MMRVMHTVGALVLLLGYVMVTYLLQETALTLFAVLLSATLVFVYVRLKLITAAVCYGLLLCSQLPLMMFNLEEVWFIIKRLLWLE